MSDTFYKLKGNVCYLWLIRASRVRLGKVEVAPQGRPFTIPIQEAECFYCGSCEQE